MNVGWYDEAEDICVYIQEVPNKIETKFEFFFTWNIFKTQFSIPQPTIGSKLITSIQLLFIKFSLFPNPTQLTIYKIHVQRKHQQFLFFVFFHLEITAVITEQ